MPSSPNVLLVITHDTGRHTGPYGRGVSTPQLERLATEGVVFDRAFCSAPQCSPSRAGLLTGVAPHTNGLVGLAHRGFGMHPESYKHTLPRLLSDAGYQTLLFGFQHEATDPRRLGYQRVVQSDRPRGHRCRDVVPTVEDFLAVPPREPFYASVGFSETHRPFDPTDGPLDDVLVPPYLPDHPVVRRDVADLNAQVRRADEAVGRILAALDLSGLAENTLFIYTTDHGIAFPGAKGTLRDPGLEVSLIARGPGGFTGGRRVAGLVSNLDLYATILELTGVPVPPDTQGISLLPLAQGRVKSVRDAVFGELTYHTAYDPMRAVRTERYKYIRSYAERPDSLPTHVDASPTKDFLRDQGYFERRRPAEQLYDLLADPGEQVNLAADPASGPILAELRLRLDNWMTETGDPLLAGDIPPPASAIVTSVESYEP